jgi:outer membrane protein assembly factor BamB
MLSYVLLVALALPLNKPGEWPQWRGPNRDGVSPDTGLLTEWPKDGPKLLWEAKGAGRGYSTVAIANGKIYTLGDNLSKEDTDEYATCFDDATGKPVWKTKLGKAWEGVRQESWQSSRSTPTIDGDHIYYMTPDGSLVCLQTADGKEVWRKSMTKDFQGDKGDQWGYSEGPLVDGDNVVVTPGKAAHTMVALNKKTGELVWSTPVQGDKGAGHSSIVISTVGGIKVYVQTTASNVLGVRAKDGKLLWKYAIGATAVIPTPIVKDDLVVAPAGYGKGCALLCQKPDGDGVKVEEVYGYKKGLANKHGGIVLLGDYLYGCADDKNTVWCAKLMTGEVEEGWKARGSGSGSVAISAADGHLYARFQNGVLALVKASPGKYEEVSSFKIPHVEKRPSWSHPVIINGKLYLREGDWILCYDVKK